MACDTGWADSTANTRRHPAIGQAIAAMRRLGQGALPLYPAIPADEPLLTQPCDPTPSPWAVETVSRRAARGLADLFQTHTPHSVQWDLIVDYIQYLMHATQPHGTRNNASAGAVLLAAGCLLSGHRWASTWAMAGAIRIAAWASGNASLIDDDLRRRIHDASEIAQALRDVAPTMPARAVQWLEDFTGRLIAPDTGTFAMHPDDAGLALTLPGGIDAAIADFADRIRKLRDNPWTRAVLLQNGVTNKENGLAPDRGELDEIGRNVLTLRAHMHIKHDFGPVIDWTTILNGDIESNVSLNYLPHVAELARGYAAYGDTRYADHAIAMLESWFDQSPCPELWKQLQWRTLEIGNRLTGAWLTAAMAMID